MLNKLFGNDEIKEELEIAKDSIVVLEERLRGKEVYVQSLKDDNQQLRTEIQLLKEEIKRLKNVPNHFGRVSRATERNLNILRELKSEGLSYSAIAIRMAELTGEKWSKSTVHHLLNR
jgi:predicted RNase H-like nuclease (RuvC/YqgF family)